MLTGRLRSWAPDAFDQAADLAPRLRQDPACEALIAELEAMTRRNQNVVAARTLLATLVNAGLVPPRQGLAAVMAALPDGIAGDEAFARLSRQDLAAPASGWWGAPSGSSHQVAGSPLRQLVELVLASGAAPMPSARWRGLLARQPAAALCQALPDQVALGWARTANNDAPDAARRDQLDAATAAVLAACPADQLAAFGQDGNGRLMWAGLLRHRADALLARMLRAGLRPADQPALLRGLACTGDAGLLSVVLEAGMAEPTALVPPFVACLGPAEQPRPGELDGLALLLARGASAATPVDGDAPIAVAAALGRQDAVALLRAHGAASAALLPERALFWRHRRLAALVGYPAPTLSFEPEDDPGFGPSISQERLGRRHMGWLLRGSCGNVNCGYAVIVEEAAGFRVLLEDAGHSFAVVQSGRDGFGDIRIVGRSSAAAHFETIWRFDGRVYQPARCTELRFTGNGRMQRVRTACG